MMTHYREGRRRIRRNIGRLAARGSALILSYFIIATLLGFTLPRTIRSVSNFQLERREAQYSQMEQAAEAGLDYALSILKKTTGTGQGPGFGTTNSTRPNVDDFGSCVSGWDCLPTATLGSVSYDVRAKDDGYTTADGVESVDGWRLKPFGNSGKWVVRKRIRVIVTNPALKDTNVPETMTYEMIVNVHRIGTDGEFYNGGVVGKGQITIGIGSTLKGEVISFYNGQEAVYVKQGAVVKGRVTINSSTLPKTDARLCCDDIDAIRVSISSSAKIRDSNDTITIADNSNGNSTDGDFLTGYPETPAWGSRNPNDLQPYGRPAACKSPYTPIDSSIASSSTFTFCKSDDTDAVCSAGGKIGIYDATTGITDYCFNSLEMNGGTSSAYTKAQFQGEKVRVWAIDKVPGSAGWGIRANRYSQIYSFKKGETPGVTKKELTLLIPKTLNVADPYYGIRIFHDSDLFGSIFAPESYIKLGMDTETDPNEGVIDIPGYLVGKDIWLRAGGEIRIRKNVAGAGDTFLVQVLSVRKCATATCNP